MKLSELRPCEGCSGPLMPPPVGAFYVVEISTAVIDPRAARGVAGLCAIWNTTVDDPKALLIAEAMAPDPDVVKTTPAERVALCVDCCGSLLGIVGRRARDEAAAVAEEQAPAP